MSEREGERETGREKKELLYVMSVIYNIIAIIYHIAVNVFSFI